MVLKKVAPYGDWESPITVESVTSKSRRISSPRVCDKTGRLYFAETKENGNNCIVEVTADGLNDVLPEEYSASNTVYEYGGSPYTVLPDGRIIFSNKDNAVYILEPDTAEVTKLTGSPTLRYANFSPEPAGPWVLAVQEDHEHDTPLEVRNYVVAINTDTAEVRRIVAGADFYYTPIFSPDGSTVVWLEWNHPDLPFSAAALRSAAWVGDGVITGSSLMSAGSAAEPRWGPDGSLFYSAEIGEFRQLFRVLPGKLSTPPVEIKGPVDAELGEITWLQGSQTYAVLSDKYVIATAFSYGTCPLVLINLETGAWSYIVSRDKLAEVRFDSIARISDTAALVVGGGTATAQTLYRLEITSETDFAKLTAIRSSTDDDDASISPALFSSPELVTIPCPAGTSPARTVYGFLWPPHNPSYSAPPGALPPLIVSVHGGPTAFGGPSLRLRAQYFTSRGYAFLMLNYSGSSGHGRSYRDRLWGRWGVIDADDSADAARWLSQQGRVARGKVGITGGSAGGYNTLQSLARHADAFAAGVCICGVSDVARLAVTTHKLEAKYADVLVLPRGGEGMSADEKDKAFREVSPLFHAAKISSPLLLLHGTDDTVVPIEQARSIAKAVEENGGTVRIVEVEGEGHMFSKPGSDIIWLEEEEKWWRETLL